MANIIDYVRYYRNKTFEEVPFNEVDALLFANLSYLKFDKYSSKFPMSISELSNEYFPKMTQEKLKQEAKILRDAHNMLNAMKNTKRYQNLIFSGYKKVIEKEIQFGALTIRTDDFVYVSFEGTNSYISGWKEDCHLSHRYPIPSHLLAEQYLLENIKESDQVIYLGGHSKGGNLSIAGAMKSPEYIKNRIKAIYDFDGPGMRESEFQSDEYQSIKEKIKKYVPNHSVVGMMMYSPNNIKAVNSSAKSVLQHYPSSWNCFGSFFVEDSLSRKSIRFSREIKKFVKEYSEEEMERFIETLFKVFKKAGIEQTETLSIKKMAKCLAYINTIRADEKTKEKALKLVDMLIDLHR